MTAKVFTGTISQGVMAGFASQASDVNDKLVAVEALVPNSNTSLKSAVAALHTSLNTIGTNAETTLGQDSGTFAPTGGGNKGQ